MPFQNFFTDQFCIYGAGIVAASIYTAIKELYHKKPLFFLVSDSGDRSGMLGEFDNQAHELDGIAVKTLSEWRSQMQEIPDIYLIATPEIHHSAIIDSLLNLEFPSLNESQIIPITNELENELMEKYYQSLPDCTTVCSLLESQMNECSSVAKMQSECELPAYGRHEDTVDTVQVFRVQSHLDKPLCHSCETEELQKKSDDAHCSYVYPIQAGGALTNQIIADLRDDTGENISAKNRNYCELTATYHAWKNSYAAYKGICHYRRIFDINDEQMQTLLSIEKEWDVILPYPSVYYPNIAQEHTRYVSGSDWNAMLQALWETAPEYLAAYEKAVADGERFFNNFNMLIAKSTAFDDYCSFLFAVLERTEELTTPKGWERTDRFAGYLGENLTTIYFAKNRDKWKIAYAGKIWLT